MLDHPFSTDRQCLVQILLEMRKIVHIGLRCPTQNRLGLTDDLIGRQVGRWRCNTAKLESAHSLHNRPISNSQPDISRIEVVDLTRVLETNSYNSGHNISHGAAAEKPRYVDVSRASITHGGRGGNRTSQLM